MNNYNAVQEILNSTPNPFYPSYFHQLFPDSYPNGMRNHNEMLMPLSAEKGRVRKALAGRKEEFAAPRVSSPAEPVQPKPKHKRRSKNEKDGRIHICGCGKDYLSYPALYTHIKTKHGGKNPGGADQIPTTRTRGRPKKAFL